MLYVWDTIKAGYLRLIEPVADWLARRRVNPNVITTIGTLWMLLAAVIYGTGHIRLAGWVLTLTAFFDVVDGMVARRTGRETVFGAFYDSTLDRISDGALLAGLTVFWASATPHHSLTMVIVCLAAIIGAFLTSYTRARAEGLGHDAKVGLIQRPERIALLSGPQALFGLAFDGWVLKGIVTLLAVTSWITVAQRIAFVHRVTNGEKRPADRANRAPAAAGAPPVAGQAGGASAPAPTAPRPELAHAAAPASVRTPR
jgi:CDP-diacylglycerol--glycerol-3-phosphate 3-phosphatidyltransferase